MNQGKREINTRHFESREEFGEGDIKTKTT